MWCFNCLLLSANNICCYIKSLNNTAGHTVLCRWYLVLPLDQQWVTSSSSEGPDICHNSGSSMTSTAWSRRGCYCRSSDCVLAVSSCSDHRHQSLIWPCQAALVRRVRSRWFVSGRTAAASSCRSALLRVRSRCFLVSGCADSCQTALLRRAMTAVPGSRFPSIDSDCTGLSRCPVITH